jgi:hypothetical protein
MQEAKIKVNEIVVRGKEEFKSLLTKIDSEISKKADDAKLTESKKKLEETQTKTLKRLENAQGKFEALMESEKKLKNSISQLLIKKVEENSTNPAIKNIFESK